MERRELDGLTREELITRAEGLGVERPRALTQAELIDEILARTAQNDAERARARGFLGRARDLLSRVVERGLHLPETARVLQSAPAEGSWPSPPPPLATVTLAEIYAAQGHAERAVAVLDEVLARAPQDEEALRLRARLLARTEPAPAGGVEAVTPGDPRASEPRAGEPCASEPCAGEPCASEPRASEPAPSVRGLPATSAGDPGDPLPAPCSDPSPAEQPTPGSAAATGGDSSAVMTITEGLQGGLAELPARYDVDEIVGMAVDPETLYLYWEVRPTTLARARARRPGGQLVIRVIAVLPTWEGPVVEQRDLPIDALFGDMFVRDIPSGSNLRMSTGWLDGESFEPFAVGLEVAAPRALSSALPRHASDSPAAGTELSVPSERGAPSPALPAIAKPAPEGPIVFADACAGEAAASAGEALAAPATDANAGEELAATATGAKAGEAAATGASAGEALATGANASEALATGASAVEAAAAAASVGEAPAASTAHAGAAAEEAPAAEPAVAAVARAVSGSSVSTAQGTHGASPAPVHDGTAEEPPRFPSGTVPTPAALARAVAATRGGSSELGRGSGQGPQAAGSSALLRPGIRRSGLTSGGSELWRSFSVRPRSPSPSR